jgi:hypothetical protein
MKGNSRGLYKLQVGPLKSAFYGPTPPVVQQVFSLLLIYRIYIYICITV